MNLHGVYGSWVRQAERKRSSHLDAFLAFPVASTVDPCRRPSRRVPRLEVPRDGPTGRRPVVRSWLLRGVPVVGAPTDRHAAV